MRVTDSDPAPRLTWKGRARKRRRGGRTRPEVEFRLESMPDGDNGLAQLLARHGIDELVSEATGSDLLDELRPIGQLANQRSRRTYVQGLTAPTRSFASCSATPSALRGTARCASSAGGSTRS